MNDSVLGWKFFGGYNFNEYLGAEFAYVNAGEPEIKLGNTTLVIIDVSGFSFAGLFRYPVTSEFSIFAKGGGFIWSLEAEAKRPATTIAEDDGISYIAGLGAEYEVTENFGVRAEWERYDYDNSVDLFSFGLLYKF